MTVKNQSNSFAIIGSFLVLELLAFAGFSLANSVILYGACGLVIAVLVYLGTKVDFAGKGFSSFGLFLIPLFIYTLLLLISGFSSSFSVVENLFVPIALVSFGCVGALVREQKEFKLSTALLVIYGSLAVLVLISYFWTMVQYKPFYTITYSDYYHYYNGTRSPVPVGETAYFLIGFSLEQVSIEYFSLFATLLATSVAALFFINPKEDKKTFTLYSIFAFVGILPLITMPTKMTILMDVLFIIVLAIVICIVKFKNFLKTFKYVGFTILGLAAFVILIFFANAQTNIHLFDGLRNFISSNALLDRLFNTNRFVSKYFEIVSDFFKNINLIFSNGVGEVKFLGFGYNEGSFSTDSILIDNFMMSGFLGTISFIVFVVFGCISLFKFVKNEKIPQLHKVILLGFIATFFAYSILSYDMQPYIYFSDYIPFYFSGPFMIVMFMFGYTFNITKQEDETQFVVQNDENEEGVLEL